MKKKVLAVEDDGGYHRHWHNELDDKVELLSAHSIETAERMFAENPDIDAIIMDACVPGDFPTTPSLVQKFRQTFSGPMIAVSSLPEYREELVAAGCSHSSDKFSLPSKLLKVLGL